MWTRSLLMIPCLILWCAVVVYAVEVTSSDSSSPSPKNESIVLVTAATTATLSSPASVSNNADNQNSESLAVSPSSSLVGSQQPTPPMDRIISPSYSPSSSPTTSPTDYDRRYKDFHPSPQLDEYFEHNKYPVPPAHPEAKTFGGPPHQYVEGSWRTPVKFPQTRPITVNDHPYPYVKDYPDERHKTVYESGPKTIYEAGHKKDYDTPPKYLPHETQIQAWDKTIKKPYIHNEERHQGYDLSASPWKKIIKILTAFIPIGLLISALTPSVITIMPVNGSSYGAGPIYRGRSTPEGVNATTISPIGLSLLSAIRADGCDERILCELLLSAEETSNSEATVKNLIESYTQGKGNSVKLDHIYSAIKERGNCSLLQCDNIKKKKKKHH